ncbi:MAG: PIN domain-containing protein [Acidimicrobiales bacterium]
MVLTDWLIDKSALWKLPRSPDYVTWLGQINRGRVRIALPTRLEVIVSARNADHWPVMRDQLIGPLLEVQATPRSEAIAVEIMEALLSVGLHRSVPLPDVMIASVAVVEHLTVLHHDRDFDRIAEAYGGPSVERLDVPDG